MRAYYFLLPLALILVSCNKEVKKTEKTSKTKTTKLADSTAYFVNEQYGDISYQVDAFNLGIERISNPDLKEYLKTHLNELKTLQNDFQLTASSNNIEIATKSEAHQNELYKLSIADAKDFDNIFVMYYKDFLNSTIKGLADKNITNEDFTKLKNKYGNILYDQKLYFDVLK